MVNKHEEMNGFRYCGEDPEDDDGSGQWVEGGTGVSDTALKPEVSYDFKKGESRMLHLCPICGRVIWNYPICYGCGFRIDGGDDGGGRAEI